jgi:hypothetical protein
LGTEPSDDCECLKEQFDQKSNNDQNPLKYVLYFSAKASAGPYHCIGTASGISPYVLVVRDETLACHTSQGGAIDPSGFLDPISGNRFVVYKVDGNNIGHGGNCNNGIEPIQSTPIMLQMVNNTDGITPLGQPIQILDRDDLDGPLVEAPSLVRLGDKYFLFFSSNCFSGQFYDVSFAVADKLTGPYVKRGPLLVTGDLGLYAPGGMEVSEDGKHVVWHAGQLEKRYMYFGELSYGGGTTVKVCTGGVCKEAD